MIDSRLDTAGKPLPKTQCPTCGYAADCATCIDKMQARPSSGDFTVCLKCGEILVFNPDFTVRFPTVSEMMDVPDETDDLLMRTQRLIRQRRLLK